MIADEISFFELYGDDDVCRRDRCEQQVTDSHIRRRPKCDDKAEHDRVTNDSINKRRPERQVFVLFTAPVSIDLTQTEQVKVVNEKCREQYQSPSDEKQEP